MLTDHVAYGVVSNLKPNRLLGLLRQRFQIVAPTHRHRVRRSSRSVERKRSKTRGERDVDGGLQSQKKCECVKVTDEAKGQRDYGGHLWSRNHLLPYFPPRYHSLLVREFFFPLCLSKYPPEIIRCANDFTSSSVKGRGLLRDAGSVSNNRRSSETHLIVP
jgi:hypothetical protein